LKYRLIILWIFIGLVCAADIYWASRNRHFLAETELNPIGRWLISVDGGRPDLLISAKWLLNLVGGLILILLYGYRRSWCAAATYVLAAIQLALLFVLWN
jgi:hypothetical protein